MIIKKNGNILTRNIYVPEAMNILQGNIYTSESPFILSGKSSDTYTTTQNYCEVTPLNKYYITAKSDKEWANEHYTSYHEETYGKVTLFLYLRKEYSDTLYNKYDITINLNSSTMVEDGVWEYTIPDGYNELAIRVNTYSDNENTITSKFWDIRVIPEKYFINQKEMLVSKEYICVRDITEW